MNVGILIYDGVEELDFVGPLEVFGNANDYLDDANQFNIFQIGKTLERTVCGNKTIVTPHYSYDNSPKLDILVVPGGLGSRQERYNQKTKSFIIEQYQSLKYIVSVCTGSLILAETELLSGKKATTYSSAIPLLKQYPEITVISNVRYTVDGNIVTSAGIIAGIDASLYVLSQCHGDELSDKVKNIMGVRT